MCDLCLKNPCTDPRCPNYKPLRARHYCSSCGEGILMEMNISKIKMVNTDIMIVFTE